MSHAAPGQLAAYNSLQDKHLSGYFNNGRMKRHLVKSGLITKKGKIIDEKTYRLNMAKKEHKKHVRDLLATAIIHKALDMERTRQYEIRKRLDEVYKIELVRRVKEDRKKKGDEDILPLLTPRERSARRRKHVRPATAPAGLNGSAQPSEIHYDENTGRLCYTIEGGQETAMNSYLRDDEDPNGSPYTRAYPGTYPIPAPPPAGTPRRPRPNSSVLARKRTRPVRFHYLARTEPAVAHRVQLQSMAEVTMKFLGPSLLLTNSLFPEDRLSEVMVLQQHCGGSTLCVFRELLPPNTIFTFVSRRHRGAPFGLTFYIDSIQDIRLSSCCEYKHKPGHILGGRNGHFQFVQVEGAAPCYRCQVASGVRDHTPKDSREQEGDEKDNRSKTFLTQDEANQSRESFDVIITKVDPSEKEDQDSAEKVDGSTQTPRDEKEDTAASDLEDEEEKEKSDESSAEEKDKEEKDEEKEVEQGEDPATEKYDDEDFEDEEEHEEKSTKDSEDEKPKDEENDSDKEDEPKTDDYKDDFDSDKENESDKESADETKLDKESKQGDSDAEEKHDETEKKDDVKEGDNEEEEDEVEVEDETEEKKKEDQEKQEDNDSVHDSDSDMKPSRTVSFDEDVKIINANEDTAADVEDEVGKQDDKKSDDKPEEIPEIPEDDPDETNTKDEAEMDDSTREVTTKTGPEPEVDGGSDDAELKKDPEDPAIIPSDNEQDKQDKEVTEKENDGSEIEESEKIERRKEIEQEDHQESKNDDDNTGKDEPEKRNAEEVKDVPVEDSVDDSSVKPEDSLEVVSPEPTESDSSSDSSSSSSSDSDSDDEKDGVDEPDHDPGKDPDLVAEKLPQQALKVIGITPGTKHEGSIQPLVEDKKDIELASLALDAEQVDELAGIIDKKEDVGSITLRNTEINDESIEKLVEVLKKSSSVKMLNLNVNRVGPQGSQHIADLIRESKSLRMLLLHANPLQDEGVHHILDAIINTADTALNNLDLGDCKMKDDGAKDVARLLLNNTTITDLTISGNHIGLSGWRIISSALEQNNTLKSLSLDFSNLGDDEAVILAEGIKENKGLRSLDLEGNRIGDVGGRSLLEAVKANATIVDLTLMPMNDISKDICDEIKGILEQRSKNRVSSASSSISSLLSRSAPSRPLKDEDSEVERPNIGSLDEDTKKDDVESSKENVSSSVGVDDENKMGDSIDDTGKSSNEADTPADSTPNETDLDNREITSEENKKQNKKVESSDDDKKKNEMIQMMIKNPKKRKV